MNKLNNVYVTYLKIPKSIAGRTKHPRGPHAALGPCVWDPCCKVFLKMYWQRIMLHCMFCVRMHFFFVFFLTNKTTTFCQNFHSQLQRLQDGTLWSENRQQRYVKYFKSTYRQNSAILWKVRHIYAELISKDCRSILYFVYLEKFEVSEILLVIKKLKQNDLLQFCKQYLRKIAIKTKETKQTSWHGRFRKHYYFHPIR